MSAALDRAKVTAAMRKVLKKWPKAEYMTRVGNKKHVYLYQIWSGDTLLGTSADPQGIWDLVARKIK